MQTQQSAAITKFPTLHCCNAVYLQHGGGNCWGQNDVTVTPCIPLRANTIDDSVLEASKTADCTASSPEIVEFPRRQMQATRRCATSFMIDDILRPDFGVRHQTDADEGPCLSSSSSADTWQSRPPRRTATTSTATPGDAATRLGSGGEAFSIDASLPAWIYCTRYSDRPKSGNNYDNNSECICITQNRKFSDAFVAADKQVFL